MKEIYLAGAVRTAIGALAGAYVEVPAPALGSTVIKAALQRAQVPHSEVNEVIFGNVIGAGLGQNVARQAAIVHPNDRPRSALRSSSCRPGDRPRWADRHRHGSLRARRDQPHRRAGVPGHPAS